MKFWSLMWSVVSVFIMTVVPAADAQGVRGELRPGRYTGEIRFSNPERKVAVIADIYFRAPSDLKDFPRMAATVKVGLGGYQTHEYLTETFNQLHYDFDGGSLTFEQPENDLVMTTEVRAIGGRTRIIGPVAVKSSAAHGVLDLIEESDEPPDDLAAPAGGKESDMEFISRLEGHYSGDCDGKRSAIQIVTSRGLSAEASLGGSGLRLETRYRISGWFGSQSHPLCGPIQQGAWCTQFHFSEGHYDWVHGQLILKGETNVNKCVVSGSNLYCDIRSFHANLKCHLKAESRIQSSPRFFSRLAHIAPTTEERRALPEALPPFSKDLTEALQGNFAGFLHNESNDTYFAMDLKVLTFVSTDNPHNQNQVMVSALASVWIGDRSSGFRFVQPFSTQAFYLRPGFALSDAGTDGFLLIKEWRRGLIRGDWHSRAFGRVGSVQLVKRDPPPDSQGLRLVPGAEGEFIRRDRPTNGAHWVKFIFAANSATGSDSVLRFTGLHQVLSGNTPVREIKLGVLDPYTGHLAMRLVRDEKETFGRGRLDDSGLWLHWPPHAAAGSIGDSFEFKIHEPLVSSARGN